MKNLIRDMTISSKERRNERGGGQAEGEHVSVLYVRFVDVPRE